MCIFKYKQTSQQYTVEGES